MEVQHEDSFETRSSRDSQLAFESFFTAEDSSVSVSPDSSQARSRTRSAARSSSKIGGLGMPTASLKYSVPCTPSRATAPSTKGAATPNLDHVLSFHQKVSPSVFHPNVFPSINFEPDSLGPREIRGSQHWRFYSPNPGNDSSYNIPPDLPDEISLSESEDSSFDYSHQIFLLTRSHACVPGNNAVSHIYDDSEHAPSLFVDTNTSSHLSGRRTKSLPALSFSSVGKKCAIDCPRFESVRGISKSIAYGSNIKDATPERMRSSISCTPYTPGVENSVSLSAFEVITSLNKSARNGKRLLATGHKLIIEPLRRFQRVINRVIS
ncbi:hypothetical protein M0805_003258 [Coniferiporia weirii]|nr:hypothetical protein M0805_003258 [Coniferiporia weirii]